jgi:hypothetical protein
LPRLLISIYIPISVEEFLGPAGSTKLLGKIKRLIPSATGADQDFATKDCRFRTKNGMRKCYMQHISPVKYGRGGWGAR